jgi:hypothetical protein
MDRSLEQSAIDAVGVVLGLDPEGPDPSLFVPRGRVLHRLIREVVLHDVHRSSDTENLRGPQGLDLTAGMHRDGCGAVLHAIGQKLGVRLLRLIGEQSPEEPQ